MEFDRSESLGGSDVAAIMGLSKYRSGMHVAAEKLGEPLETVDPEENRFVFWGLRLEDTLREVYAEKMGMKTPTGRWKKGHSVKVPDPKHHETHAWAHASPDGIVETPGGSWGLEIKTCSAYRSGDWGEPGSSDVPAYYMVQCLWYMWIFKKDRWDVAVLIGGNDFRIYTIHRDEKVEENIDLLVGIAQNWWIDHVISGHPVPVKGTEADGKALKLMFPEEVDGTVGATGEVVEWVRAHKKLKEKMKKDKGEADRLYRLITGFMGDFGTLDCGAMGTLTYKAPKPSEKTDWAAISLRLYDLVAEGKPCDSDDLKYIVKKNTKEVKNARRMDASNITTGDDTNE